MGLRAQFNLAILTALLFGYEGAGIVLHGLLPSPTAFDSLMASLGWVFLAVVLLLNLMLHYIVLKPMEQVNSFARAVSLGEMDAEIYQKSGRDEIAQLATSFNRMRRSLDTAMRMLGT